MHCQHGFEGTSSIVPLFVLPARNRITKCAPSCFNVYTRWNATNVPWYFLPFYFCFRWRRLIFTGHLDKQEQVYLKFNVSVQVCGICQFCHRGETNGSASFCCCCCLFSHWAQESLTFIDHRCFIFCCTQLYYQSNGHVVHCKILYIESIILNVF